MLRLKRTKHPDPVNVNARITLLSDDDLFLFVETAIMASGHFLSQWRMHKGDHLRSAQQQLGWALEGVVELERRRDHALPP